MRNPIGHVLIHRPHTIRNLWLNAKKWGQECAGGGWRMEQGHDLQETPCLRRHPTYGMTLNQLGPQGQYEKETSAGLPIGLTATLPLEEIPIILRRL